MSACFRNTKFGETDRSHKNLSYLAETLLIPMKLVTINFVNVFKACCTCLPKCNDLFAPVTDAI